MPRIELMQQQIQTYFTAEKQESILFVLAGILAIAASAVLLRTAHAYRGMAYPLIGVALIQIVVGGTVWLRTAGQMQGLTVQLRQDPDAYRTAETQRMAVVVKNFKLYKLLEIALLAAGLFLTMAFGQSMLMYGIGVGLVLQSSLMLVLDLFAEKRADLYVSAIRDNL